jgi:hypothetical protein
MVPMNGPLAQLVEQQTLNLRVASSILARLKIASATINGVSLSFSVKIGLSADF